jgi:lipopolysaccharide biosynthesis regulator YciM
MISVVKEKDRELGLLYSADLEMKKGDHSKALAIIRSIGRTDRFDVNLRLASALGHLGSKKEALDMLFSMKDAIVSSGTVDGLDRVYMQMADVSSASNDDDSSISYLTKALGVTTDNGRKKIYGLLASSYNSLGMSGKATECSLRSR